MALPLLDVPMNEPERRTTLKSLCLALGAVALPGCATWRSAPVPIAQGDHASAVSQLRTWLQERMRRHPTTNLSVAVLAGDSVVFAVGHGLADPERKIAVTEHTQFRAGSVSKVFTAMAALRLAEQGRLDLDAPLSQALPGFSMRRRFDSTAPVTPRQILGHRAGLPTDWAQGMWSDTPQPLTQLVQALQTEYQPLPPGQMYAYSNVGFSLLGAAIEQLTDEPFAHWMQRELLQPMGMHASAFEIAAPTGALAARALDARGRAEHEPGLRDMPAGGLNTTVLDLLQLARLWFGKGRLGGRQILQPESLVAMQTPQVPPALSDAATVGLGWHLQDEEFDGVGPILSHAGGTPHHHAQLLVLPQAQLAVAVLSSAVHAGVLAHDTAQHAMALMLRAHTGRDVVRPLRQGADPAYPSAKAAAYAGHYDTPMGLVHIEGQGLRLQASLAGQGLPLVRQSDGYYKLEARLLGLIPVDLGTLGEVTFNRHDTTDGQAWLIARRKGRFALVGTRLQALPIPTAWLARLGSYRYVGDDAFLSAQVGQVRLMEEAGLLVVDVQAGPDSTRWALACVNDNEATVRGLGRSRGDTVHAREEDDATVLYYSGMRLVRTG